MRSLISQGVIGGNRSRAFGGIYARVFLARRKEVAPCSVTANADIYVCSSRKVKQRTALF